MVGTTIADCNVGNVSKGEDKMVEYAVPIGGGDGGRVGIELQNGMVDALIRRLHTRGVGVVNHCMGEHHRHGFL